MVKTRPKKYPRRRSNGRAEKKEIYLPTDIVCNILVRLPAELILSCRCVCKSWYALTLDPFFIRKQLEWSKYHESDRCILQLRQGSNLQNLRLLDINERIIRELPFKKIKLPEATYSNQYKLSAYSIVCSCNGLICLTPKGRLDSVIICNPITRDCLILPTTPAELFWPVRSYQLGFHLDSSSGKYKVIREFRYDDDRPSSFELITVGENSWKNLRNPLHYVIEQGYDAAIYWNGGFHWKISEANNRHDTSCILSFDLAEEKFFAISFPERHHRRNYQLVGLGGGLKIVEHERCRFLNVWAVTGNKVEGFSMFMQYSYVFCVPPRRMLQHDMICEIGKQMYLMQVSRWEKGTYKSRLEIFSPLMEQHQEFDMNALPAHFKIVCFKPSLASPLQPYLFN